MATVNAVGRSSAKELPRLSVRLILGLSSKWPDTELVSGSSRVAGI